MITPTQMRAARAMIDKPQGYVADHLGIAANTLSKIESGQSDASASRIQDIQSCYEHEGIEFTENDGVRWRNNPITRMNGEQGLEKFLDDIYQVATTSGGEICLFNAKPENWLRWMGEDWFQKRSEKLAGYTTNFSMKSLISEGNRSFIGSAYQKYRWLPQNTLLNDDQSLYIYGDKLGFVNFKESDVEIVVFTNVQFAEGIRVLFNTTWDNLATLPST